MKISDAYYTYGISKRKLAKMIPNISEDQPVKKLYVVTLPILEHGLLEIYEHGTLLHKFYDGYREDITVVGLAPDEESAFLLVEEMIQDVYDATGDKLSVKEFFADGGKKKDASHHTPRS